MMFFVKLADRDSIRVMDRTKPTDNRLTDKRQDSSPVRRTVQRGGQRRGGQELPRSRPSIRKLAAADRTRSGPYISNNERPYYQPVS